MGCTISYDGDEIGWAPAVHVRSKSLDPRPKGRRRFRLVASSPEHAAFRRDGARGELLGKPSLSDSGLAPQQINLAPPLSASLESVEDCGLR